MYRIEMLPAYEGDSLWVEYGDAASPRRLVIDAGRKETYRDLAKRVHALTQPAELFVMTHIDDDHVFGALPLFADKRVDHSTFKDVWYNCYTHLDPAIARRPPADRLGPLNGEFFALLLLRGRYSWNEAFDKGATVVVPDAGPLPRLTLAGDMTLTLLSPTWQGLSLLKTYWEKELKHLKPGDSKGAEAIWSNRRDLQPDRLGRSKVPELPVNVDDRIKRDQTKDPSETNGSSIAFLAEHDGHAVLFTGDAYPSVLEQAIKRLLRERDKTTLALDVLKVSHHGSQNNTSAGLLNLLDCRRFLISTDGTLHNHPDQEAIARIVYRNRNQPEPTQLYFNFRTDWNKVWDNDALKRQWKYETHYPPEGCVVAL